jgi:alpha-N-arabinofuranosidase
VSGETYDLRPEQERPGDGRVHHVADLGPFSLLDAAATCDEAGGRVAVAVVNRDRDRDLVATIDLGGSGIASEIAVAEVNGPDVGAINSFESPRAVDTTERRIPAPRGAFEHRFPAHSVSVLRFAVAR